MYVNGGSVLELVYCDFERMRYRKCDDYLADNITESGEYMLYVNSRLHKVYCDFSTGMYVDSTCIVAFLPPMFNILYVHTWKNKFLGKAITQFRHNQMEVSVIDKCDSEDCYSLNLTYENDIDLINHVKKYYACEQSIEVCK